MAKVSFSVQSGGVYRISDYDLEGSRRWCKETNARHLEQRSQVFERHATAGGVRVNFVVIISKPKDTRCSRCEGTGQVLRTSWSGVPADATTQVSCPRCKGEGRTQL